MLMQTDPSIARALEPVGMAEWSSSDATSSVDLSWLFSHTHTPPDNAFITYIKLTLFPSETSPLAGLQTLHHLFIFLCPPFPPSVTKGCKGAFLSLLLFTSRGLWGIMYQEHIGEKSISLHSKSFVHELIGPRWVTNMLVQQKKTHIFGCSATNNGWKGWGGGFKERERKHHKRRKCSLRIIKWNSNDPHGRTGWSELLI